MNVSNLLVLAIGQNCASGNIASNTILRSVYRSLHCSQIQYIKDDFLTDDITEYVLLVAQEMEYIYYILYMLPAFCNTKQCCGLSSGQTKASFYKIGILTTFSLPKTFWHVCFFCLCLFYFVTALFSPVSESLSLVLAISFLQQPCSLSLTLTHCKVQSAAHLLAEFCFLSQGKRKEKTEPLLIKLFTQTPVSHRPNILWQY